MGHRPRGKLNSGGDRMQQREITLGQVTYQISRVYTGNRPVSELVADRLAQNFPVCGPVDERPAEDL